MVGPDQLNGGELAPLAKRIGSSLPYLEENERSFGIAVD
jgi:hypothetical protein